uniref:Uncharacterized protein n=1 Tax=Lactuca sativa TaxID=4236 RepID=A0A9R1X404_LACSA|nr:hypothetical protein LSAT_V11C700346000 [Lactuca sativa]
MLLGENPSKISSTQSREYTLAKGISHIPVEALRRTRIRIGSIGENPLLQGLNSGNRRHRSRLFSRLISESAASLSSISSALNKAKRLIGDLETYINDRLFRSSDVSQILPGNQEHNTYLPNGGDIHLQLLRM